MTSFSLSNRATIDTISANGKQDATYSYLDVPIPVTITVTAESTNEVTLYRKPSGTVTERYEISKLSSTKAEKAEDGKQIYVFKWTPSSDDYQDFIWAVANGVNGQDETYPIRLRYQKNPPIK